VIATLDRVTSTRRRSRRARRSRKPALPSQTNRAQIAQEKGQASRPTEADSSSRVSTCSAFPSSITATRFPSSATTMPSQRNGLPRGYCGFGEGARCGGGKSRRRRAAGQAPGGEAREHRAHPVRTAPLSPDRWDRQQEGWPRSVRWSHRASPLRRGTACGRPHLGSKPTLRRRELRRISVGQPVTFHTDVNPDRTYTGWSRRPERRDGRRLLAAAAEKRYRATG